MFHHLTKGLIGVGRINEVVDLLRQMLNKGHGVHSLVYNKMILGFLELGNLDKANELLDEINERMIPATCLLEVLLKHGKVDEVFSTFRKVGTKPNSKPFIMDVDGYRNIISRYCESGVLPEVEMLFQELCSKSLSPHVPPHTILIDGYLKADRIDEALGIFNKMVVSGLRVVATFGNRVFDELIKKGKIVECAQIFEQNGRKRS
ncbi:hypothetical protein RYX36_006765 [Vicia faba]